MATYNSSNIVVQFDNSGGSLQTITQYVREISVADVNIILQESHSFGDAWVEFLSTGIRKMEKITLRGFYDDAASPAPNAIFNALGDTRTWKITWGGSKTTEVETIIESYKRIPQVNQTTLYEVVLQPTGAVTEV